MRDPFREGLASGWKHVDASELAADRTFDADVVIVGSGAGGGVTAEILVGGRAHVIIVEEGPLRTSSDFKMRESEAYPALYQDSASRQTADKAIKILQGRCVGGSTTVELDQQLPYPPGDPAMVAGSSRAQESLGRSNGAVVRGHGTAPPCRPVALATE